MGDEVKELLRKSKRDWKSNRVGSYSGKTYPKRETAKKSTLTKSSPESAPTEVMDSLLIERGILPPDRGAVAASSAIFFLSLANISSGQLYLAGWCMMCPCVILSH